MNEERYKNISVGIDETKNVLHENILQSLQEQEKLEDLSERSENLGRFAKMFKKRSKKYKCMFVKKNYKHLASMTMFMVGIITLIVLFAL